MGCNRLGDPGVDPAQWPPIVKQGLELGVTFFDTSNSYNQGRSEEVLGEVTSGYPIPTVIATKGGVPGRDERLPEPRLRGRDHPGSRRGQPPAAEAATASICTCCTARA